MLGNFTKQEDNFKSEPSRSFNGKYSLVEEKNWTQEEENNEIAKKSHGKQIIMRLTNSIRLSPREMESKENTFEKIVEMGNQRLDRAKPDGSWEHRRSAETSVCSGNQENDHSWELSSSPARIPLLVSWPAPVPSVSTCCVRFDTPVLLISNFPWKNNSSVKCMLCNPHISS